MKTAKEFLQNKYPQMRGEKWNSHAIIDDNWTAQMMEEYASQDKWVIVGESKPEIGSSVLTYPHFKILPFGNLEEYKTGIIEQDTDFWEWNDYLQDIVKPNPYPTHWQPLPTPPKK